MKVVWVGYKIIPNVHYFQNLHNKYISQIVAKNYLPISSPFRWTLWFPLVYSISTVIGAE